MLVYRVDEAPADARDAWRRIQQRVRQLGDSPAHDAATSLLIDLGELESAVLDRLFPDKDGVGAVAAALRAASNAAGRVFRASWRSRPELPRATGALQSAVAAMDSEELPSSVARRVSEGYAYYALHPETYVAAAEAFSRAVRPQRVVCLGIRSIGASLSAVVGAALEADGVPVSSWTVRPRGHPFDREIRLEPAFELALSREAPSSHFAIVDEGPGLSGSSFAAVARQLTTLGVDDARIHLFPSWEADPRRFRSGAGKAAWATHPRWLVAAGVAGVGIDAITSGQRSVDWSGGAWRPHLIPREEDYPPVHGQHERVKRCLPEAEVLLRFAGLGRYGEERFARAQALADAGYGAAPLFLKDGYLALPFIPGRPLTGADEQDALRLVPRYLAFLARRFPASPPVDLEGLHHMIETHGAEDGCGAVPPLRAFSAALADAPTTALDGRMLVHEFIRTAGGVVKTDALDHASDHFYPGLTDIVWDLAAVEAEFQLPHSTFEAIVAAFAQSTSDPGVSARLPFYRLAYAAFQIGYCSMAADAMSGAERQRFEARRRRFAARARALLVS